MIQKVLIVAVYDGFYGRWGADVTLANLREKLFRYTFEKISKHSLNHAFIFCVRFESPKSATFRR